MNTLIHIFLVMHWAAFAFAARLIPRKYSFNWNADFQCNAQERLIIGHELNMASQIAEYVSQHVQDGPFFHEFFPDSLTRTDTGAVDNNFVLQISGIFERHSQMWDHENPEIEIKISCPKLAGSDCDRTLENDDERRWAAWMQKSQTDLTVCPIFFDPNGPFKSTNDVLNDCQSPSPSCKYLKDFHKTRSIVVVHEFNHTGYAMDPNRKPEEKARDYAYGIEDCLHLAQGTFNRATATYASPYVKGSRTITPSPMCTSTSQPSIEGLCKDTLAEKNADNLALFAAGVYFSRQCGRIIAVNTGLPSSDAGAGGGPSPPAHAISRPFSEPVCTLEEGGLLLLEPEEETDDDTSADPGSRSAASISLRA